MSAQPLVSIIIPCHDAEGYVGEAIQSALDQTYPRTEVVVIDDGSTDGSLDVVRSFGKRVRWETGPNRGGSAARNRGIELGQGELVQFLDADDVLLPQKLGRQVPLMVERAGDVVFCDWESYAEDAAGGRIVHRLQFDNEKTDPVTFALQSKMQTPSPLHWSSNLARIGGFRVGLPCSQERDLHLRLACLGLSFLHMPEVMYRVRTVSGSVSSDFLAVLDQHAEIFRRAWYMLRGSNGLTERRKKAFARVMAADGNYYVQRQAVGKARHHYRIARGMHRTGWLQAFHPALRPLARVAPVAAAQLTTVKRRARP